MGADVTCHQSHVLHGVLPCISIILQVPDDSYRYTLSHDEPVLCSGPLKSLSCLQRTSRPMGQADPILQPGDEVRAGKSSQSLTHSIEANTYQH